MFKVSDVSPEMAELHSSIKIINDLLGGTKTMREMGETYLPKFQLEDAKQYKNRLNRTTLYPALKETLSQMNGRVFFYPIVVADVEQRIRENILPDVDLDGNNLDVFASEWFYSALACGVSYVLVDYTNTKDAQTLADEKAQGARPYFVHIPPSSVLGFRTERKNGKRVFTQFRYKEFVDVVDGDFGVKTIEQINVYEIGKVTKYRPVDGKTGSIEYTKIDEVELKVVGAVLDFIPIVPFVTDQSKYFGVGKPPLLELAYLNIKHWQSQSDQDNILNTVRVPLLARTGVTEQDDLRVGGSIIDLPRESNLFYVEHTGNAIGAGRESIRDLELQMLVAGAKLLVKSVIAMTESQASDERSKEISLLRLYANKFEDALDLALEYAGFWLGIKKVGNVEISGNIDNEVNPNASLDMVIKLKAAGVISTQSTFEEARRRGLIADSLTWEVEQVRLDGEGMSSEAFEKGNDG